VRKTLGATSVVLVASIFSMLLALADKLPCPTGAWNSTYGQYQDFCYSDIYPLYWSEGLASGKVPYTGHAVEYPVLTGWAMEVAAWLVRGSTDVDARGLHFFYVTVAMLAVCGIAGILATSYAAGSDGRWQGIMVALSPALILGAFINWDLIAMALGMLGVAAWAARRPVLAGVLLGLAVAAKFYPLVIFGPLLLLTLRTGKWREFGQTLAGAVVAWLAVNVPVMIIAPSGWSWFYVYSQTRPADWGSIWLFFQNYNVPILGNSQIGILNFMATAFFVLLFAGIAWLALAAPRRPRLPQLCYLVLAAFLLTNKVWSPQYVVWLVPLAVLARPRLWAYALWQLGETVYFLAIWSYLITVGLAGGASPGVAPGISTDWYFAAIVFRVVTVVILGAYIVRDILNPERDVVRYGGIDDPAGGIFDGAPDTFRLNIPLRKARVYQT
jgi:uncharacterized membrane protein